MIAWVLRRLRGEVGFTLIEMITVMAIMSVVFAGITTAFVSASKAQNDQDRRFRAQLNTRLALDKIRKDIHCASDVTPFATNSVTIKLPFVDDATEPNAVFDALLKPQDFYFGEFAHAAAP